MKTSKKQRPIGKITKRKPKVKSVDYQPFLLEDLKNLDYAAGYLTAALEESESVFLLAVKNLAQAQGGMSALATATSLNRENLYSMLSKKGNPRLASIKKVLNELGLEVKFLPKLQGKNAA